MAQLPAFAVDGGTVPASMARRMTHAVSGGANGIIAPGDLKVTALSTAGGAVQIARGGAICRARTTGAHEDESYVIAQDSAYTLPVPATGGTARTEYIIARVMDWHFTGDPAPANPTTALYWEFTRVSTLTGITTPYVPLAKLTIPANTSAITNGMITNLRELALPRRAMAMGFYHPTTMTVFTTSYKTVGTINIEVPEWATYMRFKGDFDGIGVLGGWAQGSVSILTLSQASQATAYKVEGDSNFTVRTSTASVGHVNIPPAARGTIVPFEFRARATQVGPASATVTPRVDGHSSLTLLVEFEERAI